MTPEPLRLTLAERELVVNVLRNYYRDHRGDPEMGAWPTAARDLAERFTTSTGPVVERDEAAELREAVKTWARAKDEYFRSGIKKPTTGDWGAVIDLEDDLRRLVGMEEG